MAPPRPTRPKVGRNPETPQKAEGQRMEPQVSVPMAKAAKAENPRVAIFGECVHLLWAQGNTEAAIQMEQLGNQLANKYDVDILCGYSVDRLRHMMNDLVYHRICAEHSAVHSL